MARQPTPTNPAEGHWADTYRVSTGTSIPWGRPLYGTGMNCSCGHRFGRVSNSSPSSPDGKADAREAYQLHLAARGYLNLTGTTTNPEVTR